MDERAKEEEDNIVAETTVEMTVAAAQFDVAAAAQMIQAREDEPCINLTCHPTNPLGSMRLLSIMQHASLSLKTWGGRSTQIWSISDHKFRD